MGFLSKVLPFAGAALGVAVPGLAPFIGPALGAFQQQRNSNKSTKLGQQAAQMADPFGSQRGQYQGMLSDIYTNPQAYLNNPSHQAVQAKQMNAINSRNRASGYLGSGKSDMDLADYQAQSDAQYLDQEKQRLAELSGAGFNPSAGAGYLYQGGQQALNYGNMALGSAMTPMMKSWYDDFMRKSGGVPPSQQQMDTAYNQAGGAGDPGGASESGGLGGLYAPNQQQMDTAYNQAGGYGDPGGYDTGGGLDLSSLWGGGP